MNDSQESYHLGTSDEELDRLGFQHQVWQDVTLKLWDKAGFDFGQDLLDLGCGPGFATLELARLVGSKGKVHAIDASEKFVSYLKNCIAAGGVSNIDAQSGDVHSIPMEDQQVDGVFARWLMCFVTNPQKVCDEVYRVLRPGGVFVAWDYFNYQAVGVFPGRDSFRKLFASYYQSATDHGGSYDIAQELPRMMHDSGMEVLHLEPVNRAARPGSLVWKWVSLFNTSYLPRLVEQGMMTEQETQQFRQDWAELESDPSAFFYPPPMLGIIARKPH
jgi:ubiquinone/menaquinone biosynthesis C-methylase UbiE